MSGDGGSNISEVHKRKSGGLGGRGGKERTLEWSSSPDAMETEMKQAQ